MTQYTDNHLRNPPDYPPDMGYDSFDPYLDGDYTPPSGDQVAIYLLEQKLPSYFEVSFSLTDFSASFNVPNIATTHSHVDLFSATAEQGSIEAETSEVTIDGSATLDSLEITGEAPEEPFTLVFGLQSFRSTFSLSDFAVAANVDSVETSFVRTDISGSTTMGSIKAETNRSDLEATHAIETIEFTIALEE